MDRRPGCRIRAYGAALGHADGENAYGLRTVAAPVLDTAGAPVAGISFTIDAERVPLEEFVSRAKQEVLQVAKELTAAVRNSAGTIGVGSRRLASS